MTQSKRWRLFPTLRCHLSTHPLKTRNHAIYRVRVESLRYPKFPLSTVTKLVDETVVINTAISPSGTSVTNSSTSIIPPMSITLCGAHYLSPCLKLSDADYAHLGKVAGQPVVVPGVQWSSTSQTSTRSSWKAGSTQEDGHPQVDYFAVVCTDLGRLVAVNVEPLSVPIKESVYDWFIKSFVIDDMTNCKRYSFACDKWLGSGEVGFTCQNTTATGRARSPSQISTPHTFRNLLDEVPSGLRSNEGDQQEIVRLNRVFPLCSSTVHENAHSTGNIALAREHNVVSQGDLINFSATQAMIAADKQKPSVESVHIKLPRLVRSRDVTDSETCLSSSHDNGLDSISTEMCERRTRLQLTQYSKVIQEVCVVENRGNEDTWPHYYFNQNEVDCISLAEKKLVPQMHIPETKLFHRSDKTTVQMVLILESAISRASLRETVELPAHNVCHRSLRKEESKAKVTATETQSLARESVLVKLPSAFGEQCPNSVGSGEVNQKCDKAEAEKLGSLQIASSPPFGGAEQLVNKIDLRLLTVTMNESVNELEPLEDALPANVNTTSEDIHVALQLVDLYFDPNYSGIQRVSDTDPKETSGLGELTDGDHHGAKHQVPHDSSLEVLDSVKEVGVDCRENQIDFATPSDTRLTEIATPNYDVDDFWNCDSQQSHTQTNNNMYIQ